MRMSMCHGSEQCTGGTCAGGAFPFEQLHMQCRYLCTA